jgi:regulator of extracellular matrix RemA (YlzA/DUF370 family)
VRIEFLHVGFDNVIAANRVIAIVGVGSAPVKRMIHDASDRGMLVDMTSGRKTKSVIVLDSGHIALAALQPETIAARLNTQNRTPPAPTEFRGADSESADAQP